MCSRFFLLEHHHREVMRALGIVAPAFASRYNIAPGTRIPAVRQREPGGPRAAVSLLWGLVPSWANSASDTPRLINARGETLATKPVFRESFARRRCVIPASGCFEWRHLGRRREPWLFRRADERPFCFAGLWAEWRQPDGDVLETCAIVTTTANTLVRSVHDRMPVVLAPAQCAAWLDASLASPGPELLRPTPAGDWQALRLSPHVNSVRHDDPACLAPATEVETELPLAPPAG